jgi:regulation of enolase protein 1 (concanavalin A-like superfamily)
VKTPRSLTPRTLTPRSRTHPLAAIPVLLATVAAATLASLPAQAATLPPPENWPAFEYGGIVTDKDTMLYNPTDEYIFPSVFHAGDYLDDPLGEWYLYFAPHNAPAGIMLMYADDLEGPWTEYQADPENPAPIIASDWAPYYDVSHVSSPDVIWHEETDEIFLYFHGENSTTRYASSTDGISFEYGDRVVWNELGGPRVSETSYARVFPHPDPSSGYAYGMFYMGNETDNIRRIRLAESVDGITWTVDPDYVVAPGPEEGTNVSGADLWEWEGQHYVIYHASSGNSYARTIDPTLRDVGSTPILLHRASGVGDDVGRVAAPNVVTHEGETYLFYESGDRLGATIAWAKQNGFAEPEPPRGDFPSDPQNPVFAECAADGSDEFEGELAAGVWDRVVRADEARHEVTDGALTVPTYTGGVAAAPLLQQELPAASWQVTTEVQIDATERFQQAGLLLYGSDTHYAKLDLGRATPGDTVELVFFDEGSNRQDTTARPADADRMWLRLTSDGTEIRASISYTGQEFTEFGRPIPEASAEFTHVGPYAFRGSTTAPEIDASFEWLRFSPDAATYEECINAPEPPADTETAPPAKGVLSSTSGWANGLHDGTFEVRMNIWWGANASRMTLYENGEPIETRHLVAAGPAAQSAEVPLTGRVNGSYVYTAELVNSRGTTWTDPITVQVTDAEPAQPVLSSDNWDRDGSYRVTADLWWGTNATSWRLLEDGVEVARGELVAATPAAQRVDVDLTGRSAGTHEYVVEFANAAGVTLSAPHTVEVR